MVNYHHCQNLFQQESAQCGLVIGGQRYPDRAEVIDSFYNGPAREPYSRCPDLPDDSVGESTDHTRRRAVRFTLEYHALVQHPAPAAVTALEPELSAVGGSLPAICRPALRAGHSEIDATVASRWKRVIEAIGANPEAWQIN